MRLFSLGFFFVLGGWVFFFTSNSYATTTTYVYDELNRLHQVWYDTSSYIEYNYDEIGNLVSKIVYTGITDSTTPSSVAYPGGGSYNTGQEVALSCGDIGTHCNYIYYTTDGSTPTTSSAVYVDPIIITKNTTLKFFAIDIASNKEAVNTQNYTINSTDSPHVQVISTGIVYNSLQDAYEAANNGDTLKILGLGYTENLFANSAISVTIDGGYTSGFSSNSGGTTTLYGLVHLYSGSFIIKNVNIHN